MEALELGTEVTGDSDPATENRHGIHGQLPCRIYPSKNQTRLEFELSLIKNLSGLSRNHPTRVTGKFSGKILE